MTSPSSNEPPRIERLWDPEPARPGVADAVGTGDDAGTDLSAGTGDDAGTDLSAGTGVEIVVFDMGGVLVRLASLPELLGLGADTSDFWPRWLRSPAVRRFEQGDDTPENFARLLVDELELAITPAEFLTNFQAFCTGLYPGAAQLVADVGRTHRTALLSNTNSLHWTGQVDAETIRHLCDHNFLSFELGLLKPDESIYRHVAAEVDVAPEHILFLDDNRINVDGAAAAGWRAEVVAGPVQARARLGELGLVADGS